MQENSPVCTSSYNCPPCNLSLLLYTALYVKPWKSMILASILQELCSHAINASTTLPWIWTDFCMTLAGPRPYVLKKTALPRFNRVMSWKISASGVRKLLSNSLGYSSLPSAWQSTFVPQILHARGDSELGSFPNTSISKFNKAEALGQRALRFNKSYIDYRIYEYI